jgi:hypothetical protein
MLCRLMHPVVLCSYSYWTITAHTSHSSVCCWPSACPSTARQTTVAQIRITCFSSCPIHTPSLGVPSHHSASAASSVFCTWPSASFSPRRAATKSWRGGGESRPPTSPAWVLDTGVERDTGSKESNLAKALCRCAVPPSNPSSAVRILGREVEERRYRTSGEVATRKSSE